MPVVEQRIDPDAAAPRVGVVPVAILRGGQEQGRERGRVGSERIGVDPEELDRGQHEREHEPLRVRGNHQDVQVAEPRPQRRAELRLVRAEVLERDRRARRPQPLHVAASDLAPVQHRGAVGRDRIQGPHEGRLEQGIALRERPTVLNEDRAGAGIE